MLIKPPLPPSLLQTPGDSCCNPLSLGRLMDLIKKDVPGIYIHSIKIGNDIVEDMLNGFFKNSNDQVSLISYCGTSEAGPSK